jgi:hypothetical protein
MTRQIPRPCFMLLFILLYDGCAIPRETHQSSGDSSTPPLTIVAIGNAGETGSALRGNATYITDMYTGRHNAGTFDAMIILGNNFYDTGLNISASDVDGKVRSILGPFTIPFEGLGRSNVHAIPGNHDWYARNAIQKSLLFGLITISDFPVGLSEKGNKRAAALGQWTYYYRMPGQAFYALGGEARDSVQFVFFDSALMLRTDPPTWRGALDSLERILAGTRGRAGIGWRVLCVHHPFYTVGEHAGYSVWDDESSSVTYLTPCDKDSNSVGFLKNWLDPQDLCTEKYRLYVDSMKAAIQRSGTEVQLVLAGHDHSMQLLYYPHKDTLYSGWPRIHVVSGAGAKPTRVKFPAPPYEYTSAQRRPEKEGESVPGFAQLRFVGNRLRIVFFNANDGEIVDMGGKKEFWIDRNGVLLGE